MFASFKAPIRRLSDPGPSAMLPSARPVPQTLDAVLDCFEVPRPALVQRPPRAPRAGGQPMLAPNTHAIPGARFVVRACQAALITSATVGVLAGALAAVAIAAVCGATMLLVLILFEPKSQVGALTLMRVLSQAVILVYAQVAIVASILAWHCARAFSTFRKLLDDVETSLQPGADAHAYTQAREAMCASAYDHALGWGALSVLSASITTKPLIAIQPIFVIPCLVFGALAWASWSPAHPHQDGDVARV